MGRAGLCLLLVLCLLPLVPSCGIREEDATPIDFRSYQSYEQWSTLDGEAVVIRGYMATADVPFSPMFQLVNTPYTRRPSAGEDSFFVDVYLKDTEDFSSVSTAPVKVVGRLELAPQGSPFVDELGYESYVRIVDATYAPLSAEELTGDVAVWCAIAADGLINNVMDAFNYAHFACAWGEYTGRTAQGAPFYLQPEDARASMLTPGGQYYYGYSQGYFDRLRTRASALDAGVCEELVQVLRELEELCASAIASLQGNNYTQKPLSAQDMLDGFVGYAYTLNDAEELLAEYEALYARLTTWLKRFAL